MNTIIFEHLNFITTHIQWQSMSWEVRGMALQLMSCAGSEDFLGTLPEEDDLWRNILNIPTQRSIQGALKRSIQGRGLREQNELDITWNEIWKPELLQWFKKIDDNFIIEHPEYKNCLGRYWHPLLLNLNKFDLTDKKDKKIKKNKIEKLNNSNKMDYIIENENIKTKSKSKSKKTEIDLEYDYPCIRFSITSLKASWEEPITREARADLWNGAVNALAIKGDKSSEASARQFVGKLIREFGEKNTAAAISQLIIRPIPPADPKAFLRKQLKIMSEGKQSVNKANEMHAKVQL